MEGRAGTGEIKLMRGPVGTCGFQTFDDEIVLSVRTGDATIEQLDVAIALLQTIRSQKMASLGWAE